MGLFSKKKDDGPKGSIKTEDEILGYLDEIVALRKSLEISPGKTRINCNVYSLEEKKKLIHIEQAKEFDSLDGKSVQCGFSLDNTWFVFKSKIVIQGGRQYIAYPDYILHKERRQGGRVSFVAREAVSVSILEAFGKGTGITGKGLNISENGACASIIRVMDLGAEKEIRPGLSVFSPGQKVMLVRIKGAPGVKEFDTEGIVNRVALDGGWKVAVTFDKLPGGAKKELKYLIESRSRELKLFKKSRQKRLEIAKRKEEEMKSAPVEQSKNREKEQSMSRENTPASETTSNPAPVISSEPYTVLSMGDQIDKELTFFKNIPHCSWVKCKNPLDLSKNIRQQKAAYLVLPYLINGKNTLDHLRKFYAMNLLDDIKIIILYSEKISVEDITKCKVLGIRHLIELPMADPQKLRSIFK